MEEYVDALSDKRPEKTDAEAERESSVREEVPPETSMDRSIRTLLPLKADISDTDLQQPRQETPKVTEYCL
jgi:hypothetical protein